MITFTHFCPFERIIAKFKNVALQLNAISLSVNFDDYGLHNYDFSVEADRKINFAAGYTPDERREAMSKQLLTGVVSFRLPDQVIVKKFVVHHVLWKIPSLLTNYKNLKPEESTVGHIKTLHAEALDIIAGSDSITLKNNEKVQDDFVPYYNYLIFDNDLSVETIHIYGPAPVPEKHRFCSVKTLAGKEVEVYMDDGVNVVTGDVEVDNGSDDERPSSSDLDTGEVVNVVARYVLPSGSVENVELVQQPVTYAGYALQPDDYMMSLQIRCYLEHMMAIGSTVPEGLECVDNQYYALPLKMVGGVIGLDESVRDYWKKWVYNNEVVKALFQGIDWNSHGLYIKYKTKFCYITSDITNLACFALTFLHYLSYISDGSLFTVFANLRTCLDNGYLEFEKHPTDDYDIMVGASKKFFDTNVKRLSGLFEPFSFSASIEHSTTIPLVKEGLVIAGYDAVVNNQEGADHYFLGYIKSGKLYCVYDSMRYFGSNEKAHDVTKKFKACPESERILYLTSDVQISKGDQDFGGRIYVG
jgi:hypothetical protein